MLNKQRLFTIGSVAVLLACSFACAQESHQDKNAKAKEAVPSKTPSTPSATGAVGATATIVVAPGATVAAAPSETITPADILKASEAFGHFIGRNLKSPGVNFDLESIIKGMREGASGKPAPMSEKDYEVLMARIQEQAYAKLSAENLKAANDFMEKNAKTDKLVVLEPGKLQYLVIKEGQGAAVAEHGAPLIKYTGKYLDGTTFGSSDDAGGPITLPLDQTISGVGKGMVGMKEGEIRKIFVHPDLGYGTTGQLPPNSLLIFEVEVVKAAAPAKDGTTADAADADEEDLSLSDLGEDDEALDDFIDDDLEIEGEEAPAAEPSKS